MKFTGKAVTASKEILALEHHVGIPYDCSALATNEKGYVPAGTIVPANDATAQGVLLYDVKPDENPNGTIIVHGFIKQSALPAVPAETAVAKLTQITFM